jgi:hypothetical protein
MEDKGTKRTDICTCPFCDGEIKAISDTCAICEPCSITIVTCTSCGGPVKDGTEKCPHCGEPLC